LVAALVCLFTALPFWLLAVFKVADIPPPVTPTSNPEVAVSPAGGGPKRRY
jgi:hypothetical protein